MKHIPVLLEEALHYLDIKSDGIYVDCTLGGGGHTEAILSRLTTGHLYAFDQDKEAIARVEQRFDNKREHLTIIHDNFANIEAALSAQHLNQVDGILYDLGVSSFHFDTPKRGFSYHHDAILDMRMNEDQDLTARAIVNDWEGDILKKVLYGFGEEKFAPKIVNAIIRARAKKPIETTFELVDVIKSALPQKVLKKPGHPARKTFQALRIAVNSELEALRLSLHQGLSLLSEQGRMVVISFHSLEDRIVKETFKHATSIDHPENLPTMPEESPAFKVLHKKVIVPSDQEIAKNPRARSAKLRAIMKCSENC